MLPAKYECSSPYGLSQEDFKRFPSLILCKTLCVRAEPKYDPKGINITATSCCLYDKSIGCSRTEPKYDPRGDHFYIFSKGSSDDASCKK